MVYVTYDDDGWCTKKEEKLIEFAFQPKNGRKFPVSHENKILLNIRWTIRTSFTPVTMDTTSESLGCPLTRGLFNVAIIVVIIIVVVIVIVVIIIVIVIVTIIVVIIIIIIMVIIITSGGEKSERACGTGETACRC